MRRGRGFTLIEMLVVIGIIAILVSLLIPGITAIKKTANTARCLSNMRQIGMANLAFAADHEGRSAGGGGNTNGSVAWQNILSVEHFRINGMIPRLGGGGSLYCPEGRAYWEGRSSPGNRTLSMNGSLTDTSQRPFSPGEMAALNPLYRKVTGGAWTFVSYGLGRRIDSFKSPNRKVQLIDSDRGNDTFGSSAALVLGSDPNVPYPWCAGPWSFRHPGLKINILWMDNHATTERFNAGLAVARNVSPLY